MNNFLKIAGLTLDDLEWEFELKILYRKLRDELFADKVESFYIENKLNFNEIEIKHIVVKDENTANELFSQISEDKKSFSKLAKKHSLDVTTKQAGGYVGWVRKGINTPEIEAKIFNSKVDEIYGPFKVQGGFEIISIDDMNSPDKLTDEIREEILEFLFQEEFFQKYLPAEDF